MATVLQIKSNNDIIIRQKTLPNSITTDMDADLRDVVADELKERGLLLVPNVAALATVAGANTLKTMVEGVGLFKWVGAEPSSGLYYPGADGFWVYIIVSSNDEVTSETLIRSNDFTYQLPQGFSLFALDINSTTAATIFAGKTDGANDVLFPKDFQPNVWDGTQNRVWTYGGVQNIYFKGLTGQAKIVIYKLKQH